jgi:hypothetical protein
MRELEGLMDRRLKSKTLWAAISAGCLALALTVGLIAHYSGSSPLRAISAHPINRPGWTKRKDHPKPWMKIAIDHAISIASRLAV